MQNLIDRFYDLSVAKRTIICLVLGVLIAAGVTFAALSGNGREDDKEPAKGGSGSTSSTSDDASTGAPMTPGEKARQDARDAGVPAEPTEAPSNDDTLDNLETTDSATANTEIASQGILTWCNYLRGGDQTARNAALARYFSSDLTSIINESFSGLLFQRECRIVGTAFMSDDGAGTVQIVVSYRKIDITAPEGTDEGYPTDTYGQDLVSVKDGIIIDVKAVS